MQYGWNGDGNKSIYGFPVRFGSWCKDHLKTNSTDSQIRKCVGVQGSSSQSLLRVSDAGGAWCSSLKKQRDATISGDWSNKKKLNIVYYLGIARDEPERIARHIGKKNIALPLVQIGWDEDLCGLEATYLDMLSPTYTTSSRDGCWFCHNQGVAQLRNLRSSYPCLWGKLLKLDCDSPITFHADGRTVMDFDKRFWAEDNKLVPTDRTFRWKMLESDRVKSQYIQPTIK